MATVEDVQALARGLPRSSEVYVYGRLKYRIGQIVYLAFSKDQTVLGFAFPKEERDALVETYPEKFMLPAGSDLRWNWVLARLEAIDAVELREIVLDAWQWVVPKRVAAEYLARAGLEG
jgi:hypothetical protein